MVRIRLFWSMIRRCHLEKAFLGFIGCFMLGALIIEMREPYVGSYGDAMWYVFVSCTTIGYGDYIAITPVGRIITVVLTIYEMILMALLSGVIVSHYLEVVHRREKYTATIFLEKLKHLKELDDEELEELQERVKKLVM